MESNKISDHKNNPQSSNCGNSTDAFDMNDVEKSLPNVDQCPNSETKEEQFFDAEEDNDSIHELDIDEEELKERDKDLSEEELQKLKEEATRLKTVGNESFKQSHHQEAIDLYTQALNTCPLKYQNDRSILFANRAAALIGLEKKDDALLDCNKAIELNPNYLRAILRRAQLHRKADNLDRCLEDYKKILELDKNNMEARQACATLPAEINERNEKLKEEMFGKLKELGNVCLKPFGLSTENFKVVQDPNSGGYSINFQK